MNPYVGIAVTWGVLSAVVMVCIGVRHHIKSPIKIVDPYGMVAIALSWIGAIYGAAATTPVLLVWLSHGHWWSWAAATMLTLSAFVIAWRTPKLFGQK